MHNHTHDHHPAAVETSSLDDTQAVCLITGDIIDKAEAEKLGYVREANGKKHYFCCAACVRLYDQDPKKQVQEIQTPATLRLIEKRVLVDNVWAFKFAYPEHVTWVPGQFMYVELPHQNPDSEGTKRWFTISSIPHDGYVQVTTRITSSTFKQALSGLQVGGSITLLENPAGDFIWQEDARPLVFVAGGIGVTPFYSMLKARGHSEKPVSATLIYSGRTDQLPFKEEFAYAAQRHPELTVHYVIGKRVTGEKLRALVPDLILSHVYISGPEGMVESVGKMLTEAGLPKNRMHQDFFPQYTSENY